MRSITYIVPGFGPQTERSCTAIAGRVAKQIAHAGEIIVWRWSERRPGLAAAGGAGAGIGLAKLLRLGGWATASAAAIGAIAGVGKSYVGARGDVNNHVGPMAEEFSAAARTGRDVNVVALSLGTEVALEAFDVLAQRGVSTNGILLLVGGTAERGERWSRAVRVPRGVANVYNPSDLTLWAEKAASGGSLIGHGPLELPGVENFRTAHGHFAQLDHLAEIVRGHEGPAPHVA